MNLYILTFPQQYLEMFAIQKIKAINMKDREKSVLPLVKGSTRPWDRCSQAGCAKKEAGVWSWSLSSRRSNRKRIPGLDPSQPEPQSLSWRVFISA